MELRLSKSEKMLQDAKTEIKYLTQQHKSCQILIEKLKSLTASRLTPQQFDLKNMRKTCGQFCQQYTQQLVHLDKSFKEYELKKRTENRQFVYKIKLLRDQLTVKRFKLKNMQKKLDISVRDSAAREDDFKKDAILRCIRCKARKNVIKSLEHDVVERTKVQQDMENLIAKLTQDNVRLKETVGCQNRDLIEIKSKLQDEIDKNTARSNDPALVIDVTKTPASGSTGNNFHNYPFEELNFNTINTASMVEDQGKVDKQLSRLQWLVNSKSAEVVRFGRQLQDVRHDLQAKEMELNSLSLSYEAQSNELEIYKGRCQGLPMLAQQLDTRDMQLKDTASRLVSARNEIEDLTSKNQVLQTLLTNLATSVQTMLN